MRRVFLQWDRNYGLEWIQISSSQCCKKRSYSRIILNGSHNQMSLIPRFKQWQENISRNLISAFGNSLFDFTHAHFWKCTKQLKLVYYLLSICCIVWSAEQPFQNLAGHFSQAKFAPNYTALQWKYTDSSLFQIDHCFEVENHRALQSIWRKQTDG